MIIDYQNAEEYCMNLNSLVQLLVEYKLNTNELFMLQ